MSNTQYIIKMPVLLMLANVSTTAVYMPHTWGGWRRRNNYPECLNEREEGRRRDDCSKLAFPPSLAGEVGWVHG